jgi:DNA-directed RNA polymerase sigma subunit (sigma70/sigma32)
VDNDEYVRWVLIVAQNTPLLDHEEETTLVAHLRGNDSDTRAAAIERLRLCLFRVTLSVARKYAGATVHIAEPLRAGIEGIGAAINAIERLDEPPGFKLSTFSAWHLHRVIEGAGFTKTC